MCLLVCAWQVVPGYPLLVLANRDEFHARATAPLAPWSPPGGPEILAGRDLVGGGTWLGVRGRRFAALTNVREPGVPVPPGAPSRGELVPDFLGSDREPLAWLEDLADQRYAGFNLLVCDGQRLAWGSNRAPEPRQLQPGFYGLSNAALDTPWPKVERLRAQLDLALASPLPAKGASWGAQSVTGGQAEVLLDLLYDEARPADADLPQTGVGLETERFLSSIFVSSPGYGTRSSTLVLGGAEQVELWERTHAGADSPLAYGLSPSRTEGP